MVLQYIICKFVNNIDIILHNIDNIILDNIDNIILDNIDYTSLDNIDKIVLILIIQI